MPYRHRRDALPRTLYELGAAVRGLVAVRRAGGRETWRVHALAQSRARPAGLPAPEAVFSVFFVWAVALILLPLANAIDTMPTVLGWVSLPEGD